jgi:hypothetical protein
MLHSAYPVLSMIRVIREDPAGAVVVRAWPGHRNIGRGACRSALADGVSYRLCHFCELLAIVVKSMLRSPILVRESTSENLTGAQGEPRKFRSFLRRRSLYGRGAAGLAGASCRAPLRRFEVSPSDQATHR